MAGAAVCLGSVSLPSQAQFERPALAAVPMPLEIRPDGQWRGLVGAGLTASGGNTRSLGVNLVADGVRATETSRLSMSARALHGQSEVNGERTTTADQWRLGGRHDWGRSQSPLYLFANTSAERDQQRQLGLRATTGAGVGYRRVNGPDDRWEVFGGIGWRTDRFTGAGAQIGGKLRRHYDTAEALIGEESAHRLSENTVWQQRVMLLPSLKGGGDFRVVAESVLSVAMSRHLVLTLSVSDRYDRQASAPIKRNDVLVFTGINLRVGAR